MRSTSPPSAPHSRYYVVSLTSVNVLARGAYFLVFLAIGNLYGATDLTDDVFLFYAPIAVVCTVIAGIGEVVLIPLAYRAAARHCLDHFHVQLLKKASVLALVLCPGAAAASFFVAGHPSLYALALMPIPLLAIVSAVCSSYLIATKRFRTASLSPIYGAALSAIVLYLVPQSGLGLSAAFLAYEAGRAASLVTHVMVVRSPTRKPHDCGTSDMLAAAFRGSWQQALGSLLVALNPVVDMLFAKGLGAGAVSSIEYANRMWMIVPLLFSGALILTHAGFSRVAAEGSLSLKEVHRQAARLAVLGLFATALSSAVTLLWGVDWIFGWGKMDDASRNSVASVFVAYLAGAAPYLASLVYVRAFSALSDIGRITKSALLSVVANIVLDALLIGPFGVVGLGVATTLRYYLVAGYLLFHARRLGPAIPGALKRED